MKLVVDNKKRLSNCRAHTATHLLHAQLATIFPQTKQSGSLVDQDYLRFDFATDRPLSSTEIKDIENNVNQLIAQWLDVVKSEMSMDEAIALWAKAFFEEKYGNVVRVVKIWEKVSTELCGGTHVNNTADIWAFKITSQEAVASWIRRINAVTWPKVAYHAQQQEDFIESVANTLDTTPKQLLQKIEKVKKDTADLESQTTSYKTKLLNFALQELLAKSTSKEDISVIINVSQSMLDYGFSIKELAEKTKELLWSDKTALLFSNDGSYAVISSLNSWSAKSFVSKNSLKWGGSDSLVVWKDAKVLELA